MVATKSLGVNLFCASTLVTIFSFALPDVPPLSVSPIGLITFFIFLVQIDLTYICILSI